MSCSCNGTNPSPWIIKLFNKSWLSSGSQNNLLPDDTCKERSTVKAGSVPVTAENTWVEVLSCRDGWLQWSLIEWLNDDTNFICDVDCETICQWQKLFFMRDWTMTSQQKNYNEKPSEENFQFFQGGFCHSRFWEIASSDCACVNVFHRTIICHQFWGVAISAWIHFLQQKTITIVVN